MTAVIYDADATLASLERPELRVRGVVHVGRPLSAYQWFRCMAALDKARASGSMFAFMQAAKVCFDAMFPKPWWRVWERSVALTLLAMPPAVWQDALNTFFVSPMMARPATGTPMTPAETMAATPMPPPSPADA